MSIFNKQILIIGNKPSTKNLSSDVPFVGTRSYETLCTWIGKLQIPLSNITIVNSYDLLSKLYYAYILMQNRHHIICLGQEAHKSLIKLCNELNIDIAKIKTKTIDHPSGSNLKLNDKKYIQKMLKDTKKWLHS